MATTVKDVASGVWSATPMPEKVLQGTARIGGKAGFVELEAADPSVGGRKAPFLYQLKQPLTVTAKGQFLKGYSCWVR